MSRAAVKSLYDSLHPDAPSAADTHVLPSTKRMTAKTISRLLLNSEEYRLSLVNRIITGTLPSAIECKLWDYAYGKPIEKVEVKDTTNQLENYTPEELEARALFLAETARRIRMNDEIHASSDEDDPESPSVH